LIITTTTETWNDGYIGSWQEYNYSYSSTESTSTDTSTETITSSTSTSENGTATTSSSDSTSTSTSGGTGTLGYYTTPSNTYNTTHCQDLTATSCTATRSAYGSDFGTVRFNPSNTLLVYVQGRSSGVLESQVLGQTSSPSNTIVIIQGSFISE